MDNDTEIYDEYVRNTLDKAINDIIKAEGYVTYTVNKRIISSNGDSFMGALCEVSIKSETMEGNNTTNIFMKICNPYHQVTFLDITQAYYMELYVYKELSNIYANLQEDFDVPLNERYRMTKFYNGCSHEVIALENMREQGFVTHHRTEAVSLHFIELAVIELAKFHTLSFVLEQKRPLYFEKKIKNIRYHVKFNEEWNNFITKLIGTSVKFLDEDVEMKLANLLKNLTKKISAHVSDGSTVRCLCHGDYRPSNILMKRVDDAILKVIPIDYQIIFYGSPVLDFLYFIFGSTDREFRRVHLSQLKDLYHDTLKRFLDYFNMNVETIYPRKEFERVFEEKLDYGLMISLIMTPILFAEDDMQDLTVSTLSTHQANEECKRRLLGTIEEFIELGYL